MTRTPVAAPTHNKHAAADFLTTLDPAAQRFTFQFFSDGGDPYAEILHGTLDEAWSKIQALNTPGRGVGVFVTINETDFQGRRRENIVRARALWVDADSADQICHCERMIHATGVAPTMVVRSSLDRAHYYWCCDDIALDEFSAHQAALIKALGTDPAVKDLPRVMRLPGTLHLKDPSRPQLATLDAPSASPQWWKLKELTTKLRLATKPAQVDQFKGTDSVFTRADVDRLRRLFGDQYLAHNNELSAGIEINIAEIKSAVAAIPPSAISTEQQWMKFARGLAHEARVYPGHAEELWQVLDAHSCSAVGYDQDENRNRWTRYVDESIDRDQPITIASVFAMAKEHGWAGWSPAPGTPTVATTQSITAGLDVTFANIPHRKFLYGIDLSRGEITVLASPGGTGKSSLAIGIVVSLVVAQKLLDEKIWGAGLKTLYVNGEDSALEMRRRFWGFCRRHGLTEQDIGNLLLLGADDWRAHKLSFLRTEKSNSVIDEIAVGFLESLLKELRPDLVVLDPLISFCAGGNVNDNAVMALVMRALKRLANKFDCAILILHHTRKGGEPGSAEAISGASSIVNLARRAIMVVPMTKEEAAAFGIFPSEYRSYFKVVSAKSNLAPPSDDCPWYKLESIPLPNAEPPIYPTGDNVQAVVRVKLSSLNRPSDPDHQKIKKAILDLIDRGKSVGGQYVPYSPNVSGAHNARALIDDAIVAVQAATAPRSWQEADLRAAVTRSVSSLRSEGGLIDKEITGGQFRRRRGLNVDWDKTPWRPAKDSAAPQDAHADLTEQVSV
jgi:hypothetical protein